MNQKNITEIDCYQIISKGVLNRLVMHANGEKEKETFDEFVENISKEIAISTDVFVREIRRGTRFRWFFAGAFFCLFFIKSFIL